MEAKSSIGACIVRKALIEGPTPLWLDTMAISDQSFRLRISNIVPDLIVTFKSTSSFYALAGSGAQVTEAISRSDAVLAQFKSCTVILPCSSSSLASDHIAKNEHQDVSYIFSDEDPVLLAIELAQSVHPEVLDTLTGEVSNAWTEQASSWEAFELAVSSLHLHGSEASMAPSLSFYESLQGIGAATSAPNAVSDISDLCGISRESAKELVAIFQSTD
jgi:hypothetical protein